MTPLIAILAAYIAFQQWRTAHNRLKLDMFDRRLAVYAAAREIIRVVTVLGAVKGDHYLALVEGTRQARWLLGSAMQDYFDNEMIPKSGLLQSLEEELAGITDQLGRKKNLAKQRELKNWIQDQRGVLDRKFDAYLKMPR